MELRPPFRLRVALSLAIALVLACGDKNPESPAAAPMPAKDDGAPVGAEPMSEELPTIDNIPPLTAEAVAAAGAPAAKAANAEALAAHRAGKLDAAIAGYEAALRIDPGHILARYNLASALVTNKKPRRGLAVLKQFADLGCEECGERLVRAREDAEWEPLWADPLFDAITTLEISGALVGVTDFEVPVPTVEGSKVTTAPIIWIDRKPGFAKIPAFELVLRRGSSEVSRRAVNDKRLRGYKIEAGALVIPGKGSYALELVADGKVFGSRGFSVLEKRCVGGKTELEAIEATGPHMLVDGDEEDYRATVGDDDADPGKLVWSMGRDMTSRDHVVVIWRRGRKVELEDEVEIGASDTSAGSCPIDVHEWELDAPGEFREPGRWTIGLYSKAGVSYELETTLRKGDALADTRFTVKSVKRPPASVKKKLDQLELEQVSLEGQRMRRALARSPELVSKVAARDAGAKPGPKALADEILALATKHGAGWSRAELPPSPLAIARPRAISKRARAPTKTTCIDTRCPSFPAISPDGKILVSRYMTQLETHSEEDGGCDKTVVTIVHYDSPKGASVDLTGFKVLECSSESPALEDGFKVAYLRKDDDRRIVLRDPKGKKLRELEIAGSGADICTAPGVRAVVVVEHESATHCREFPEPSYGVWSY